MRIRSADEKPSSVPTLPQLSPGNNKRARHTGPRIFLPARSNFVLVPRQFLSPVSLKYGTPNASRSLFLRGGVVANFFRDACLKNCHGLPKYRVRLSFMRVLLSEADVGRGCFRDCFFVFHSHSQILSRCVRGDVRFYSRDEKVVAELHGN